MTAKEAEDRRTHTEYVKATGENIGFAEYLTLRRYWRSLGGEFFGPNVEHGSMPESKLLPHLRVLADQRMIRMQYMGACALLARLSGHVRIDADDMECIHRALVDCAAITADNFEVVRAGGQGWSLEPKR